MSRSKSRQPFVPARPRAEVYTAVAVGASIVVGTILLIWLMRPGTRGVPGGGGLLNRQPRMVILALLGAAVATALSLAFVRSRRRPHLGSREAIALGTGIAVVLAVVGGIFWPGGVIRHWPKQPTLANTPATTPSSVPSRATTSTTGTTVKTPSTTSVTTSSPTTKAG